MGSLFASGTNKNAGIVDEYPKPMGSADAQGYITSADPATPSDYIAVPGGVTGGTSLETPQSLYNAQNYLKRMGPMYAESTYSKSGGVNLEPATSAAFHKMYFIKPPSTAHKNSRNHFLTGGK